VLQHLTRYFFAALALLYLHIPGAEAPLWVAPRVLDAMFAVYAALCTLSLLHAARRPVSRIMWTGRFTVPSTRPGGAAWSGSGGATMPWKRPAPERRR